jgi:ankyrin repeat protein
LWDNRNGTMSSTDDPDDPLWDAQYEVNTAIERSNGAVQPLWDVIGPRLAAYPELVRTADDLGEYPLHKAAFYDCAPALGWLIEVGAEVDAVTQCPRRMTPLHQAAERGHVFAIRRLAEAGADLARRTGDGYTPLRLAINRDEVGAVGTLLRLGAPIDLRAAVCFRQPHLVRLMLRDDSDQVQSGPDAAALVPDATFFGGNEILRLLLEAGADPTPPRVSQDSLCDALSWGNRTAVELLLAYGADPDARVSGLSPREHAERCRPEVRAWARELFSRPSGPSFSG